MHTKIAFRLEAYRVKIILDCVGFIAYPYDIFLTVFCHHLLLFEAEETEITVYYVHFTTITESFQISTWHLC